METDSPLGKSVRMSRPKANQRNLIYAATAIVGLCCSCLIGLAGVNYLLPDPAPTQALSTPMPIETIIALTFSAASAQTSIANPPSTLASPAEAIPTATIFIFQLQTDVARPTEFIYSTNTPFSLLSTSTLESIQPTTPPQIAVCACTGVDYDCKISDFATHAAAQACYEYCKSQGYGDVHKIDGNDQDGLACENLP